MFLVCIHVNLLTDWRYIELIAIQRWQNRRVLLQASTGKLRFNLIKTDLSIDGGERVDVS